MSKDVRAAYRTKDADASRRLHAKRRKFSAGVAIATSTIVSASSSSSTVGEGEPLLAKEHHGRISGSQLKALVFGGIDGVLTSVAVVAAAFASQKHNGNKEATAAVALLFGLSGVLADGIAMGIGEYTSSRAELDFAQRERQREAWELLHFAQGEREEMLQLLMSKKAMLAPDAEAIVGTLIKYPHIFLDWMLAEELHIIVPLPHTDQTAFSPSSVALAQSPSSTSPLLPSQQPNPFTHTAQTTGHSVPPKQKTFYLGAAGRQAVCMLLSFILLGCLPLLAFLLAIPSSPFLFLPLSLPATVAVSGSLATLLLVGLGAFRGYLAGKNICISALQMLAQGVTAAALSLLVAGVVTSIVDRPVPPSPPTPLPSPVPFAPTPHPPLPWWAPFAQEKKEM
eukprot:TRINITY_DN6549_c0_g4_i1.p1 TRINITY_DN6549_c0_g4~~TRINITY_DN6549_c0_g4_i1.p1  ORF type:complete len:396 (-),score=51.29 TRINITY_DN6549_c0_g4_i1:29-1216(-)